MPVVVPAIKSQGIKTKLVPWINDIILQSGLDIQNTDWFEPFFGTGVVGLNTIVGGKRIVGDTNPHIINFYKGLQKGEITPYNMGSYLTREGDELSAAAVTRGLGAPVKRTNVCEIGFHMTDFIILTVMIILTGLYLFYSLLSGVKIL